MIKFIELRLICERKQSRPFRVPMATSHTLFVAFLMIVYSNIFIHFIHRLLSAIRCVFRWRCDYTLKKGKMKKNVLRTSKHIIHMTADEWHENRLRSLLE